MKKKYLTKLKKYLKSTLSATKKIGAYARANHLALLNLSVSVAVLSQLQEVKKLISLVDEHLFKTYIDVLQAIGFDVNLTLHLIQRLFGSDDV